VAITPTKLYVQDQATLSWSRTSGSLRRRSSLHPCAADDRRRAWRHPGCFGILAAELGKLSPLLGMRATANIPFALLVRPRSAPSPSGTWTPTPTCTPTSMSSRHRKRTARVKCASQNEEAHQDHRGTLHLDLRPPAVGPAGTVPGRSATRLRRVADLPGKQYARARRPHRSLSGLVSLTPGNREKSAS